MRWICGTVIAAVGVIVGLWSAPRDLWMGLTVIVGSLTFAAWLWRCPHHGPLALLPATTRMDGTPDPARWFCQDCGKTWPANFDKTTEPIQKFTGYDEAKAVQSAQRAKDHEDRQRKLALARGGQKPAKAPLPWRKAQ